MILYRNSSFYYQQKLAVLLLVINRMFSTCQGPITIEKHSKLGEVCTHFIRAFTDIIVVLGDIAKIVLQVKSKYYQLNHG